MKKHSYSFVIYLLLLGQFCFLVAMEPTNVLISHQELHALANPVEINGRKHVLLGKNARKERKKYITEKIGFQVLDPGSYWSKEGNKIICISSLGCHWNEYKSACITAFIHEDSAKDIKDLVFHRYQLGQNGKIDQWQVKWHDFNEALLDCVPPCFDSKDNFCLYNSSPSDTIEYSISSKGVKSALPCKLCFKAHDKWYHESLANITEKKLLKAILRSRGFSVNISDENILQVYPMRFIRFPDIYVSWIEKQPILFFTWLSSLDVSDDARKAIRQAIFIQAVSQKLQEWLGTGS